MTLVLVLLNVLLIVLVHGRRIRQYVRGGRERRFQARVEAVLARLDAPTGLRDRVWLRWQLAGFDELERPLAAVALIERLRPAAPEERAEMLAVLREVGAVELLVRSDPEPDPVAARARGQNARLGRRGGDGSCADRTDRRPQPLRAGGGGAGARAGRRPAGAAAAR